jgi:hypothetical protein
MMALAAIIVVDSLVKWRRILCKTCDPLPEFEPEGDLLQQVEATEISD